MKKLVKLFDKTGNELVPDNIKNSKSTSKTDAYSCNYINNLNIKNETIVGMFQQTVNFESGSKKFKFNEDAKTKNAKEYLSITTEGIRIGKGIHTVKVTYNIRLDWNAPTEKSYYFIINKNSDEYWDTHSCIRKTNQIQQVISLTKTINVVENDIISLVYSGDAGSTTINASLTVEILD